MIPGYKMESCEEQFCFFQSTLSNLINTHLPQKTITKFINDKPWVTEEYKMLIKTRQCAFLEGNINIYKQYRNKVNRMGKNLRRKLYFTKFESIKKTYTRQWWNSINKFIGKKSTNPNLVASLNSDGDLQKPEHPGKEYRWQK